MPEIKPTQLLKSQEIIRSVLNEAVGVYIAEEPKKQDSWRETQMWRLKQHLKHEIQEIDRSITEDRFYHNCLDAINLLAMMAAKARMGKNTNAS